MSKLSKCWCWCNVKWWNYRFLKHFWFNTNIINSEIYRQFIKPKQNRIIYILFKYKLIFKLTSISSRIVSSGGVSGETLTNVITICGSVNTTTMDSTAEGSMVSLLGDISDNAAFTSDEEY